jgi:hypothetical protein
MTFLLGTGVDTSITKTDGESAEVGQTSASKESPELQAVTSTDASCEILIELAGVLVLPSVECLLADRQLPTDFLDRCTSLRRTQSERDLLVGKSRLLHGHHLLEMTARRYTDLLIFNESVFWTHVSSATTDGAVGDTQARQFL